MDCQWTNDLTLEFLDVYEKHPVLWNSCHPGHKNKNILQDAWTEVANELSVTMTVVALNRKKGSLMSTYRTQEISGFRDYWIGVIGFVLSFKVRL